MAVNSPSAHARPLDLVSNVLRAVSNQLIFCVIELESHIELTTLGAALRSTCEKLPLARSRFVGHQSSAAWVKQPAPEVTLVQASNVTKVLVATSATPLRCALQVKVLRNDICDTLLLVVDHRFTDAAGTRQLVYMLAHAYNRHLAPEERDLCYWPARFSTEREPKLDISLCRRFKALRRLQLSSDQLRLPIASHLRQLSTAYSIRRVDLGSLAKLKRYLRARGATINDLLLACVGQALRKECRAVKDARANLLFTVNLRRYMGNTRSDPIGNFSGSEQVSLDLNPTTAEATLGTIVRQTQAIKSSDPGLGALVLAELLCWRRRLRGQSILRSVLSSGAASGKFVPVMTNLGQLSEDYLSFGSVKPREASLIGPSLTIAGLTISASVFRNSLTLALGYNRNRVSTALVERVLKTVARELGGISIGSRTDNLGVDNSIIIDTI